MDKLKTLKLFGIESTNFPVSPGSTHQNFNHILYLREMKV